MKQCVYLRFDEQGKSLCGIYQGRRMSNCVIFPIDERDINDRNRVSEMPCGYYF
ncbi:MAG: hypothetical protein LBQ57_01270 [Spirochaetales bacterium]|nr:hypothetical protein [Spirochaetales bacterium]